MNRSEICWLMQDLLQSGRTVLKEWLYKASHCIRSVLPSIIKINTHKNTSMHALLLKNARPFKTLKNCMKVSNIWVKAGGASSLYNKHETCVAHLGQEQVGKNNNNCLFFFFL